jgi:hypothetical protein
MSKFDEEDGYERVHSDKSELQVSGGRSDQFKVGEHSGIGIVQSQEVGSKTGEPTLSRVERFLKGASDVISDRLNIRMTVSLKRLQIAEERNETL